MSSLAQLNIDIQRLTAERNSLEDRLRAGEPNLQPEINAISQQIQILQGQINNLRGSNSSGQLIQEEQTAKADNSNTGAPQPPGRIIYPADPNANPGTVASLPTVINDQGQRVPYLEVVVNSPVGERDVVTTTQSQSTPPGGDRKSTRLNSSH